MGNNDRHFYNWGVIGDIKHKDNKKVVFAPIYDTARGLLWNKVESKVLQMYKQYKNGSTDQIEAFLTKSKPRFSFEENAKSNHFDLIEHLSIRNVGYKDTIAELLTMEAEKNVILKLKSSISRYISAERLFLMTEILRLRFQKLRKAVNVQTF